MTKKEEARECTINDIQQELSRQGKCFVNYIKKLNPVMDELVNRYEAARPKNISVKYN